MEENLLKTLIKEMIEEEIEEAARRLDRDGDGDQDFDDVRIARYVAGGMPKKKALQKVKKNPTEK